MIGWILTVILIGNPIPFVYNGFHSEQDCKAEGYRQVRDYQAGGIRAVIDCESIELPPDPHTQT
jgi:hypothetical protein